MSVMTETSQSAMGPYVAMAAVELVLYAWTAVCREALFMKVLGGDGGDGGGGEGDGGGGDGDGGEGEGDGGEGEGDGGGGEGGGGGGDGFGGVLGPQNLHPRHLQWVQCSKANSPMHHGSHIA